MLDRVGYRLRGGADVELVFEGSFSRSKPGAPEEPAYGGHATAMGPPPADAPAGRPRPERDHAVRFDPVRGQLTEPTFGGGPSKWHLVESGGNGVALLDYDGDGLPRHLHGERASSWTSGTDAPGSRTATPSTATWAG